MIKSKTLVFSIMLVSHFFGCSQKNETIRDETEWTQPNIILIFTFVKPTSSGELESIELYDLDTDPSEKEHMQSKG